MGRLDKDRFQKELAIRYCLARKMVPFPEVLVASVSDLSDSAEVLTDLDVLGIESVGDGELKRTLFDCKTSNKMSSINRAFWAVGVMNFTGCHYAYAIQKNAAVHNHRISALTLGVDLHTDRSFIDLGKSVNVAFPEDGCYQASISRWNEIQLCYESNAWAQELYNLTRNITPLGRSPASIFRRYLAELRQVKGAFDPDKDCHVAIYLDGMASMLVLWSSMARDARRFFEPSMTKEAFERVLRYYLWGGKESYQVRQQMREKAARENATVNPVELPSWEQLVSFVGLVIGSPGAIFDCVHFCRELAFKIGCGSIEKFDVSLRGFAKANSRLKQFSLGLSDYLVGACGLPKDLSKRVQELVFSVDNPPSSLRLE